MRTLFILGSFLTASVLVANCGSDAVTCDESRTCAIEGDGSTPIDGSAGDGPITPEGCDAKADPKDAPKCVDDRFGIFVDAANGEDGNPGTKAAPLKSITGALAKLSGKARVYVCAGAYPEHVKIMAAVSIYGGFTCGTWAYDAAPASRPHVSPADRGYALQLTTIASPLIIEDLEFTAQDGTVEGESSIAVFVADSANVTFKRMALTAGKGSPANDAIEPPTNLFSAKASDLDGNANDTMTGGLLKDCACKTYGGSTGGAGGDAGNPGKQGKDGSATPIKPTAQGARTGTGGAGYTLASGTCALGLSGSDGSARIGGAGALVHGTLDSNGWAAASGSAGEAGNPGGGAGGGGGGIGVGGGSGACGGCGGAGGIPGKGGGSSIGITSVSSVLHLTEVSIITADAGKGGAGGKAEVGGAGGTGGGGAGACAGGYGGNGAGGGGGGGGGGGVSAGIVRKGGSLDGTPTVRTGQKGAGGAAGTLGAGGTNLLSTAPGGSAGAAGLDGASEDVLDVN